MDLARGAMRRAVLVAFGSLVLFANFCAEIALASRPLSADSAAVAFWDDGSAFCGTARTDPQQQADAATAPGRQEGPVKHGPKCAFCLPLLQGTLLEPATAFVDAPRTRSVALGFVHARSTLPTSADPGSRSSRGPPQTA
jgi:hypothetical protein